jgi:hypothetical protein
MRETQYGLHLWGVVSADHLVLYSGRHAFEQVLRLRTATGAA